jgi:hypothetical protein
MNGQLLAFISLFGVMNGKIVMSTDSAIYSLIAQDDGIIIQVDPLTRSFRQNTFTDLLGAVSQAESGNLPK